MSIDIYLCCHKCREALHIGQKSAGGKAYVYSGDEKVMTQLAEFLNKHSDYTSNFENLKSSDGEQCYLLTLADREMDDYIIIS